VFSSCYSNSLQTASRSWSSPRAVLLFDLPRSQFSTNLLTYLLGVVVCGGKYSVTFTSNHWLSVTVVSTVGTQSFSSPTAGTRLQSSATAGTASQSSLVVGTQLWSYPTGGTRLRFIFSRCLVHQLVLSRFHVQEPVLGYSRLQQLVLGHVQEPYSVAVVFSRSTVSPPRSRCGRWSPVTTSLYHYPTRRSSASHRSSYSTCLTDVRTEPEVPELGETGTGSETETVSLSGASFVRLASLEQLDLSHNRLEVIQRQAPACRTRGSV